MADINSQILDALNQGVGPQDIIDHLSKSENPEHRAWVANYKTNLVSDNQPSSATASTAPAAPNVSGVQALGGVANKMAQSYADLPTAAQLAIPAAVAGGSYVAGKAVNLGFKTLEDKLKASQEVKTQAALNSLPPSPAVQVQQQQLALQQAEQANRFAQQAAGANTGPVSNPLLDARVATESNRAATEAARTKAAEAQAALAQEKLIAQQRKAAMVKANPAAQTATAENLPPEAQVAPPAKPSIAQLNQLNEQLGGSAAPPAGEMAPVSPAQATPAAEPVVTPVAETPAPTTTAPTTTAEVVTDPNATPVEKAVTLTQQTPSAETPATEAKVKGAAAPRAARGSLAGVAMNPAPIEGMPGMRENYTKPKGINPATGENFIGPGGYNWLANQVGHDVAPQVWQEQYGQKNVPHSQVQSDYSATRYPPTAITAEGQSGGAFGKPKYIPDYIKGNASIGGMASAGLNALGVAGLISDYKEAKKTNDWSNFGLNATGQVLANVIPKAALPSQLATYSKELGESPEELKALGKKLQDAQQALKAGAGRGMQGVPPPYNR